MTASLNRRPTQASAAPAHTPDSQILDAFDPSGLGALPAVPLVPEATLRQHNVLVGTDHRFRAAARLLQALWREDRNLPIGLHQGRNGDATELGSRISAIAGNAGGNFLHPAIAQLVQRELVYREVGAVYDDERLRTNLLSSQPLTFNLFGPLKLDLAQATAVFQELLPGFIKEVVDIRFEHSPGRGSAHFTADGTAFDLLINGLTPTGQRAFIAIEVKYSETGFEPLPRFSGRFDDLARNSDLFIDADDPDLRTNPVQQLFRQTCLCQAMLETGLYDIGAQLFIAPRDNHLAQAMAGSYRRHLNNQAGGPIPFIAVTLEDVIASIATAGGREHAQALHRRYADFWLVDGELALQDIAPLTDADFCTMACRSAEVRQEKHHPGKKAAAQRSR